MTDVGTELARLRQSDERVEVGAVDVHLTSGAVDHRAHLADSLLEHAVRRGVRGHDRADPVAELIDLRLQVVEVDVAVGIGGDDDDVHARHHRARRVRAVRTRRNEADRALLLTDRAVVGADREQTGELALTAGIGLDAHRVVAGDLREPRLELGDHLAVSDGLVVWCERVEVGELRPRDRRHLGRAVELHRARAERDHGPVEREVAVGEPAQVPEHLVLGVQAAEDRLGHEVAAAGHLERQHRRVDRLGDVGVDTERGDHARHDVEGRRLVEADPDGVVGHPAQVVATLRRGRHHPGGVDAVDGDRVEEGVVADRQPSSGERRSERCRERPDAARRCRPIRLGRASRHRSRPCWRAAPAPCRCSTSPSPGGCAAHGSAVRGAGRAGPPCRC